MRLEINLSMQKWVSREKKEIGAFHVPPWGKDAFDLLQLTHKPEIAIAGNKPHPNKANTCLPKSYTATTSNKRHFGSCLGPSNKLIETEQVLWERFITYWRAVASP